VNPVKVKAKDSGDVNDLTVNRSKKDGKAIIEWNKWAGEFEKIETEKLPDLIVSQLLAVYPSSDIMKLLYDIKRLQCICRLHPNKKYRLLSCGYYALTRYHDRETTCLQGFINGFLIYEYNSLCMITHRLVKTQACL